MRLIDRYMLVEWAKTFLMALAATLSILLIEDIQDDLSDFIDWGATGAEILQYYMFLIPTFLPVILPMSLLVSLLFMLSNLHRNNEIIAMRASGMHLFTITRSLWLAGAVLSLALLYLNAELVPRCIEATRTIRDNHRFDKQLERTQDPDKVGLIHLLAFDNRSQNRLWLMNRFSQRTYMGHGVSIYVRDDAGKEVVRYVAKEGYYDDVEGHWVLNHGREMKFDQATGDIYFNHGFDQKLMTDFDEEPQLMLTLAKEAQDLSIDEIKALLDKISPQDNPQMHAYEVRYNSILASPFTCLIVIGIGIPFAVSGVRVNPMIGVSKAIALFVAYYVIASICSTLGEQAILSSIIAAWLPMGIMFSFSLFLFKRVS